MDIYYARVKKRVGVDWGFPLYRVILMTATQDGYQEYATLEYLDERQMKLVYNAWTGGQHELVMALLQQH